MHAYCLPVYVRHVFICVLLMANHLQIAPFIITIFYAFIYQNYGYFASIIAVRIIIIGQLVQMSPQNTRHMHIISVHKFLIVL